jgi:hypothetical protein
MEEGFGKGDGRVHSEEHGIGLLEQSSRNILDGLARDSKSQVKAIFSVLETNVHSFEHKTRLADSYTVEQFAARLPHTFRAPVKQLHSGSFGVVFTAHALSVSSNAIDGKVLGDTELVALKRFKPESWTTERGSSVSFTCDVLSHLDLSHSTPARAQPLGLPFPCA